MMFSVNGDWARFSAHGIDKLGPDGFAGWLEHTADELRAQAKREQITPQPEVQTPSSLRRFAAETARSHDARLERMAATANNIGNELHDPRWNEAALALLGARRFFRGLMQEHRKAAQ